MNSERIQIEYHAYAPELTKVFYKGKEVQGIFNRMSYAALGKDRLLHKVRRKFSRCPYFKRRVLIVAEDSYTGFKKEVGGFVSPTGYGIIRDTVKAIKEDYEVINPNLRVSISINSVHSNAI